MASMHSQEEVVDVHPRRPKLRRIGHIAKARRKVRLDPFRLFHRIGFASDDLPRHGQNLRPNRVVRYRHTLNTQRRGRPGHVHVIVDDVTARLPRRVHVARRILDDLRHAGDFVCSDRQKETPANDEALLNRGRPRIARRPCDPHCAIAPVERHEIPPPLHPLVVAEAFVNHSPQPQGREKWDRLRPHPNAADHRRIVGDRSLIVEVDGVAQARRRARKRSHHARDERIAHAGKHREQ